LGPKGNPKEMAGKVVDKHLDVMSVNSKKSVLATGILDAVTKKL